MYSGFCVMQLLTKERGHFPITCLDSPNSQLSKSQKRILSRCRHPHRVDSKFGSEACQVIQYGCEKPAKKAGQTPFLIESHGRWKERITVR